MHFYGHCRAIMATVHRAWVKVDWIIAYVLFAVAAVAIYMASH